MVARMDGRADSVPAQKTGKGRLLGRSDRQTRAAPLGSLPRDEEQNGPQTETLTSRN